MSPDAAARWKQAPGILAGKPVPSRSALACPNVNRLMGAACLLLVGEDQTETFSMPPRTPAAFSTRETLLVLEWIERAPRRRQRLQKLAHRLATTRPGSAVAGVANAILEELDRELPSLDGLAGQFLATGIRRISFQELAMALIVEAAPNAFPGCIIE
jgi:hypothetical protein